MKAILATAILTSATLVLPSLAEDAAGSFERTLNVTGAVDLDVQTGAGRIEVRAGGSSAVVIRGTIRVRDRRFSTGTARERVHSIESNPPIQQTGGTIRIGHMEDPEMRRGVSIAYEVTVPAATKLRSNTGSGTVVVEGISGPVNAETGSGDVSISRIGGEVRAHTGSGRMDLDSIEGNVDANTGSGGVKASHIKGRIVAEAGSGSVELGQTGTGDIRAHTGSGEVTVRTGSEAGFELRAHTGSGHITVDRPITVSGTISPHELMAKVGGGGNAMVEVSTGSGSIRIQ